MTPTTFLCLLKATQAERDAAPCVPPVLGSVALDRDGNTFVVEEPLYDRQWLPTGADVDGCAWLDIIATLDLQAALERLDELEQ